MLISAHLRPLQQLIPWVVATKSLLELLERIGSLAVDLLWHHDLHGDEQVTVGSVGAACALAADPQGAPIRRAGRDAHRDRHAAQSRHRDLGAKNRLGVGHGNRDGEVVSRPAEDGVRFHVHEHVKVARWPATLARRTLALEPDSLAILNACGDARLNGTAAHRPPAASTRRARIIDYEPAAPACPAGLRERETAEVPAGLAGPLTRWTDSRDRARLCPST